MADPTAAASLVLGGGCFWCTEAAYLLVPGVLKVASGYAGGESDDPTYEAVCTGTTGHAEVIRIEYDPSRVTLAALLDHFWKVHDSTQVGGQGADEGPQYRSIILYADEVQRAAAERSKAAAQARLPAPITTEIAPLGRFWPAEEYHRNYFARHPNQAYCRVVIAPKLRKLQ